MDRCVIGWEPEDAARRKRSSRYGCSFSDCPKQEAHDAESKNAPRKGQPYFLQTKRKIGILQFFPLSLYCFCGLRSFLTD